MHQKHLVLSFLLISTFTFFTHSSQASEVSSEEFEQLKARLELLENNNSEQSAIDISGFASAGFVSTKSDDNTGSFTGAEFSPAFTYTLDDRILMAAELYIAKKDDGKTETELKYATTNITINNWFTVIAGQFLSPIGQFQQYLYPSWINKLPTAPVGFDRDGPIPSNETGIQLRGSGKVKNIGMNYAVYFGNGPELKIKTNTINAPLNPLTIGIAIETIENKAFGRDLNKGKALGGRLGILPLAGIELGFSLMAGAADAEFDVFTGSSQAYTASDTTNILVTGFDFVAPYPHGVFRGEYLKQKVDALAIDKPTIQLKTQNAEWQTYYLQGSYRFTKTPWEVVARYSNFNATDKIDSKIQRMFGINYKLSENAVIKLAYGFNNGHTKTTAGNTTLLQLAYGL